VPSERPQPAPEPAPEPAPGQPSTISRPPSPTVRSPCFDFESSCAAARGAPRRQAPVTSFRFRIELRRDSVPQREERPATSPVVAACFASPDQASRPARPPARQQPIRNRNNETQRTIPRSANEDDRRPPTRPSTTDTTVDHRHDRRPPSVNRRASTAERQPPTAPSTNRSMRPGTPRHAAGSPPRSPARSCASPSVPVNSKSEQRDTADGTESRRRATPPHHSATPARHTIRHKPDPA
jgi:hypothetical protein